MRRFHITLPAELCLISKHSKVIYLDNIIFSLQRAGGVSAVWSNLISNLSELKADFKCLEFDDASSNVFRQDIHIPPGQNISLGKKASKLHEFISPKVNVREPFLFHSSYFRICKNPNAINVTTVHDFIYEQAKMNLKQKLRVKMDYAAIRRSDVIVCVSENTKKDLFHFLPDIDPDKVVVIHNGVSDHFYPLDVKPIPELEKYIMYVGGRQPYKNFDFAVEATAHSSFHLLICGSKLSDAEIKLLENKLPGRYRHILFPSNKDLNDLYNSVFALIYPSSYEGFGIPVIEAQRAKCPVIALNASSIPEIIGDSSLLLDSLDLDRTSQLLGRLENSEFRKEVVEKGFVNSQRFSWKKMSEQYAELYNRLLLQ